MDINKTLHRLNNFFCFYLQKLSVFLLNNDPECGQINIKNVVLSFFLVIFTQNIKNT